MSKESTIVREGWAVTTDTLCQGTILSWATENDDGDDIPDVFPTLEEARKEIARDMIEYLQQFIDGEREWGDNPAEEDTIVQYTEYSDGTIIIRDAEWGSVLLQTTLQEWRDNR